MGVPGRRPSGKPTRDRNPRVHEFLDVVDAPYAGQVPKLPTRRGGWPARTRALWAAWSSMPHCSLWQPSDWAFAIDTLEVAARFHEGHSPSAAELRLREKTLGTTHEARMSLRIRYVPAVPVGVEEPAEVSRLDDYRDL